MATDELTVSSDPEDKAANQRDKTSRFLTACRGNLIWTSRLRLIGQENVSLVDAESLFAEGEHLLSQGSSKVALAKFGQTWSTAEGAMRSVCELLLKKLEHYKLDGQTATTVDTIRKQLAEGTLKPLYASRNLGTVLDQVRLEQASQLPVATSRPDLRKEAFERFIRAIKRRLDLLVNSGFNIKPLKDSIEKAENLFQSGNRDQAWTDAKQVIEDLYNALIIELGSQLQVARIDSSSREQIVDKQSQAASAKLEERPRILDAITLLTDALYDIHRAQRQQEQTGGDKSWSFERLPNPSRRNKRTRVQIRASNRKGNDYDEPNPRSNKASDKHGSKR